jgi:hypothetical protein
MIQILTKEDPPGANAAEVDKQPKDFRGITKTEGESPGG